MANEFLSTFLCRRQAVVWRNVLQIGFLHLAAVKLLLLRLPGVMDRHVYVGGGRGRRGNHAESPFGSWIGAWCPGLGGLEAALVSSFAFSSGIGFSARWVGEPARGHYLRNPRHGCVSCTRLDRPSEGGTRRPERGPLSHKTAVLLPGLLPFHRTVADVTRRLIEAFKRGPRNSCILLGSLPWRCQTLRSQGWQRACRRSSKEQMLGQEELVDPEWNFGCVFYLSWTTYPMTPGHAG